MSRSSTRVRRGTVRRLGPEQSYRQILTMTAQTEITSLSGFWRSFRRNYMGVVGLLMLLLAIGMAVFAPALAPYDPKAPVKVSIDNIYAPPSRDHLLGTDDAAKDVLSQFIYGSRVSLTVGFFAAFISVAIGGWIGITAGFWGGKVETGLMRFTDVMLVIPDLPLAVVIVALTQPSLWNIIFRHRHSGLDRHRAAGALADPVGQGAQVRAAGQSHRRGQRLHHAPPHPTLGAAADGGQHRVGDLAGHPQREHAELFGPQRPDPLSWGQMLNYAFTRGAMSAGAWWVLAPPGFGIVWVVLGCTLLGQGLERVLNPRLETHHLAVARRMVARPEDRSQRSEVRGSEGQLSDT
jgi:peptide/nickel transport system permease protein